MRDNPDYRLDDVGEVRRLIEQNPWALLVSSSSRHGLVASHLPVLLEHRADDELVLLSHLGRPDEHRHELGRHDVLVIVSGPHGYVSPSWYRDGEPAVPTWNYLAVHLHGRPELLAHEDNLAVLGATVDRFEDPMPVPVRMADAGDYARRIAHGTVGFRLPVTRVEAKAKLSQDKPPEVVSRIVDALGSDPVYAEPRLATEMSRWHGGEVPGRPGR